MAGKYLVLDEAAKALGVSTDELNEMRKRQEVTAYRDGSSWKFKAEDIQSLAARRSSGALSDSEEDDLALDDLDDLMLDEPEKSASGMKSGQVPELAGGDAAAQSGKDSASESGDQGEIIDLDLDDLGLDLDDSAEMSVDSLPSSGKKEVSDLDLDLDLGDEPGTSSELELVSDDSMSLPSGKSGKAASAPSGTDDAEDEALVLSSPSQEDFSLDADDEGISLLEDDSGSSGLKLDDDVLDLSGSDALSSDLDADNLILGDDKQAAATAKAEKPTKVDVDDEFELTPFEEIDSDLSDSGSQVIALDSAEELGDEQAPLDETVAAPASGMFDEIEAGPMGVGPGLAATLPASSMGPATVIEAQYGTGTMVSLAFCSLFLLATGLMMIDLLFNLGTWQGVLPITSPLMDPIANLFGG
jgi:excisionase family DNA binding protein